MNPLGNDEQIVLEDAGIGGLLLEVAIAARVEKDMVLLVLLYYFGVLISHCLLRDACRGSLSGRGGCCCSLEALLACC